MNYENPKAAKELRPVEGMGLAAILNFGIASRNKHDAISTNGNSCSIVFFNILG